MIVDLAKIDDSYHSAGIIPRLEALGFVFGETQELTPGGVVVSTTLPEGW